MNTNNPVALFIDAENLTQWIKRGGLDSFMEELSSLGAVVIRKAYARWTSSNVTAHQSTLNRLGFELIHSFHPVSGKNSADIQITVDVMEYAVREDLRCIALATGDSDFSPLFRRLREMGKQVVGVGPRSALSESVKSSCSRFFYTETEKANTPERQAALASAFDDAADLLESALKTFDGPANCSALKNRMLNIDSAFDEKNLGFKSFTDFAKGVPGVALTQDDNAWYAVFQDSRGVVSESTQHASTPEGETQTPDTEGQYRKLLRRKHWRSLPSSLLVQSFVELQSIGPLPRSEIPETAILLCDGEITTADMKKAMDLLFKAGLVEREGQNEEGETLLRVSTAPNDEMLHAVDRAMLVRLFVGLDGSPLSFDTTHVKPLLLGSYDESELNVLIDEARKARRTSEPRDPMHKDTESNKKNAAYG